MSLKVLLIDFPISLSSSNLASQVSRAQIKEAGEGGPHCSLQVAEEMLEQGGVQPFLLHDKQQN